MKRVNSAAYWDAEQWDPDLRTSLNVIVKLRMEFWERVMKLEAAKQHEAFVMLNSAASIQTEVSMLVPKLGCRIICRYFTSVQSCFGGSQGSLLFKRHFMARQGCNFDHSGNCLEKLESSRDCLES